MTINGAEKLHSVNSELAPDGAFWLLKNALNVDYVSWQHSSPLFILRDEDTEEEHLCRQVAVRYRTGRYQYAELTAYVDADTEEILGQQVATNWFSPENALHYAFSRGIYDKTISTTDDAIDVFNSSLKYPQDDINPNLTYECTVRQGFNYVGLKCTVYTLEPHYSGVPLYSSSFTPHNYTISIYTDPQTGQVEDVHGEYPHIESDEILTIEEVCELFDIQPLAISPATLFMGVDESDQITFRYMFWLDNFYSGTERLWLDAIRSNYTDDQLAKLGG